MVAGSRTPSSLGPSRSGSISQTLSRSSSFSEFVKPRSSSVSRPQMTDLLTASFISNFVKAVEPLVKTNKAKGVYYPGTITGKEIIHWIKTSVDGYDNQRNATALAAYLVEADVLEIHSR